MNEFLSFRKMITPLMIQVIFWLGVVVIVIAAIMAMVGGFVLFGLMYLLVGPLFWRIYCELLILLFRMYDELQAIRGAVGGPTPGAPGFPVTPIPPPAYPPPTAH